MRSFSSFYHKTFLSTVSALCLISATTFADSLPLKEISLSNAGLLQMTHRGDVDGNQDFELTAQSNHIDDILKSLVIIDPKGTINSVSLPGKAPLSEKFEGLSIPPQATSSLKFLLESLKGHELRVENQGAEASGRLVTTDIEYHQTQDTKYLKPIYKLSLMGDDGLSIITIYDLAQIKIENKALRADFKKALNALKETNEKSAKTIKISLNGNDDRIVEYSYVIPAPLWKSAYRMILPDFKSKNKTGFLQGWAILENMSGQDWDDVTLSLTSGSPVTFKQNLYESYYRARPNLPIKTVGALKPHNDEGSINNPSYMHSEKNMAVRSKRSQKLASFDAAPELMAMEEASFARAPMPQSASMSDGLAQLQQAIKTKETVASQTITLGSTISLPHSHSMMAPVINNKLPMEAVSFFKSGTQDKNPYASVLLKNDSDVSLPTGIVTLYNNNTYLGDAEMPNFPKGEERMIPYALDTDVDISERKTFKRQESSIIAARGTLKLKVIQTYTYEYLVNNNASEDRLIVIDIPKQSDWSIVDDKNAQYDIEETPNFHRLRVNVNAQKAHKFDIKLTKDMWQTIAIGNLSKNRLLQIASNNPSERTAAALRELAKEYAEIDDIKNEINITNRKIQEIERSQKRIRDNLGSIPSNSNLAKRYLNDMEDQEDQISSLQEKKQRLDNDKDAALKTFQKKLFSYNWK